MAQEITMPALGESVTEGTITVWLKKVGDTVEVDEPIVEVATDKVDTEVPSPVAGVISEIVAQEDETVEVGAILAYVGEESSASTNASPDNSDASDSGDANAAMSTAHASHTRPAEPPIASLPTPPQPQWAEKPVHKTQDTFSEQSSDYEHEATPKQTEATPEQTSAEAAQKSDTDSPSVDDAHTASAPFAAQYLTPIVRKLAKELNVDLSSVKGTGVGGRIRRQDVEAAAEAMKRAEAEASAENSHISTSPASTLPKPTSVPHSAPSPASFPAITVEVDGTNLAYNFLPAVLKAAHEALTAYPALIAGDSSNTTPRCAVTLAATRGAFMPVIPNLADLSEDQIAAAVAEVSARAAAENIGPDDLIGSNFSVIDNTAQQIMLEIPHIQPSHVAALSVGARELRAKVIDEEGTIAARRTFFLSLAYDPSAADAHIASEFLKSVKGALEH